MIQITLKCSAFRESFVTAIKMFEMIALEPKSQVAGLTLVIRVAIQKKYFWLEFQLEKTLNFLFEIPTLGASTSGLLQPLGQHQNSLWAENTNDPSCMGCNNIPFSHSGIVSLYRSEPKYPT